MFFIFRKLFLEGCAPQPIVQEQDDPISEDSASDKEYKSKKKKKKGMARIERNIDNRIASDFRKNIFIP